MENLIYKLLKVFWKETENVILLSQIVPCSILRLRKSVVVGGGSGKGGSNYAS